MVLAAGLGTRLRPLTQLRPKALCPVGGVPLVDSALRRLEPYAGRGASALAVNAHAHAAAVVDHVGERAHHSLEQPEPLGTAGALGLLRDWVAGRDVLLTNVDAWLPSGLADLVAGWDGERVRLLTRETGARSDFGSRRYVGACLLPWPLVRDLRPEPSGLYEVLWRREEQAGRLDLALTEGVAIDCGTPADYLAANLDSSGGASVVGDGALVLGSVERCVVWDGAYVGPHEALADAIRAGTRQAPVTVDAR